MSICNRLVKDLLFRRNLYALNFKCISQVPPKVQYIENSVLGLSKSPIYFPGIVINRFSHSFFSRVTANQLWKGVTSVSNAGRKKGRGRGRKKMQDLNRGQVIGFGKKAMLWPGLNSPVVRGKEIISQQELPPDENREQRILEIRNQLERKRPKRSLHILDRGWSGTGLQGRSLGPPSPIDDETFEGFDSRVLMFRSLLTMTRLKGRKRTMNALVVVGNKKGLAGYGITESVNGTTAAESAKNKAAQRLRFIPRHDEHTVLHDFHATFRSITVIVLRKPKGYGLVCHRAIKAICEMIGIKDIYVKTEGNTKTTIDVTRAFFIGLMRQKSYQELADSMQLHLIEQRADRDNFPELLASPDVCRDEKDIKPHEVTDFKQIIHEGRVLEPYKPYVPFYTKLPSYAKHLRDTERLINKKDVELELYVKYGKLESHLVRKEAERAKQDIKESVEEGL